MWLGWCGVLMGFGVGLGVVCVIWECGFLVVILGCGVGLGFGYLGVSGCGLVVGG